jgi:AraC-like DNA-binding protein
MKNEIQKKTPGGAGASMDMVRMLFAYLEFQHIDCRAIEVETGINRFQTVQRIPVTAMNRLWRAARKASLDPDFGLHMGEAFVRLAQGHLLFSVMRYSPTFRVALEKFFRYHSLMGDMVTPRAVTLGETVHCLLDRNYPDLPLKRHHVEATFSIIFGSLNALSTKPVRLKEVSFCHKKPLSTMELERLFQAPLHFECPKERLVFLKESLDQPIHSSDPAYLSAHESLAGDLMKGLVGRETIVPKVTARVERTILKGDRPKIAVIAKDMAVSVRKLQALLQAEEANFRDTVSQTRKRLAERFLKQPDTSICDVAFLLGFSEQSAFNHAFRRWTGQTPRQFREL